MPVTLWPSLDLYACALVQVYKLVITSHLCLACKTIARPNIGLIDGPADGTTPTSYQETQTFCSASHLCSTNAPDEQQQQPGTPAPAMPLNGCSELQLLVQSLLCYVSTVFEHSMLINVHFKQTV
jgi:hypothetical protein